jgi:uncharacterized protein
VLSASVPEGADVDVSVEISSYPGGVMASGTVSAPWKGECRRCGGPVGGRLVVGVRERFEAGRDAGGVGGDGDAYELHDDIVDLEPLARDAVLLELPLAPLCTDACRGLCPRCGADLNAGDCGCPTDVDPRWSALDRLRSPQSG